MISVLHLVGSPVDEFHADLSRLYARDCLAALGRPASIPPRDRLRRARRALAFPRRPWTPQVSPAAAADAALAEAVDRLSATPVDVVVPQMFCRPGMTSYRALLDLVGLPYLGNRPDVMAMTADKTKARAVVAAAGVPVPDAQTLRPGDGAAHTACRWW